MTENLSDKTFAIPSSQQDALRSWLRLLGASNQIRKDLQNRLQSTHGLSLSRFDILANLYRTAEGGVRLSALSRQLMVSNGNVTQVITPLIKDGLVERRACDQDARAAMVRLTPKGTALFEAIAADHATWVGHIFATLTSDDHNQLADLLDKLGTTEPDA